MDNPKTTNRGTGLLFLGMVLLALDAVVFAKLQHAGGDTFDWIMMSLMAISAIVCFLLSGAKVVLDETGIFFSSIFSEKKYRWEDVEKVGVEKRSGYKSVTVEIVLFINGKKKRISYTRANLKCVRAYYGEPDFNEWGKEP